MNTNQRCGTCKHFGDMIPYIDEDYVDQESKFHVCNRVQHLYTCHLESSEDSAGVMDGSEYHASLIVAEDFGCTLWEASE